MTASAPLHDRDIGAGRGGLFGVFLLAEEFEEVDRLGRRGLGDEPAVDAAERVGRLALAAGNDREGQNADVVFGAGPCRSAAFGPCMPSSHWPIRSIAALPSPNMPADWACLVER